VKIIVFDFQGSKLLEGLMSEKKSNEF
jgi:hypothetical protein